MNTSESRVFAAASPDAVFIGDRTMSSKYLLHTTSFDGDVMRNFGVRETTRQQWERLKPLIQRIYIDENKPFNYLAEILRKEHGFEPTKRRFSRKIDTWGFRKNVSRKERQQIMQTIPRDMHDPVPNLDDRRLKANKLKNWQRRYREEAQPVSGTLNQPSEFQKAVPVMGIRDSAGEEEMSQAPGLQETSGTFPKTENLGEDPGIEEIHPDVINAMDIWHDEWPFDWSTVDVPGSPGLSRLYRGLETECATLIPLLTLEEGESADLMCLSNSELQELSNKSSNTATDDFDTFSSPQKKNSVAIKSKSADICPQYPWRDIDNVFCGYTASPLNEIYIFPPCQYNLHKGDTYITGLWASLTTEISELEIKFAKLETQFQDEHPAVIRLMEDLAALYCRLETPRKAERIYRRLVDIYRRRGTVNVKFLEASLGVVNSLMGQGEYSRAQSLHQTLQFAISNLVQPGHDLAISAMWTQGWIFYEFGQYEKAEMLYRQHLQVVLSLYGPRASQAIRIMVKLGGQIRGKKPEEATVQLRRAAWLCTQLRATDEKACRSMRGVARLLSLQGHFEESYNLATKTVERFAHSLGAKHPDVLDSVGQLACSMKNLGKFHESRNLFLTVIANRSNDESDEVKLKDWYALATVFDKTGEIDQAIVWYEKVVQLKVPEAGNGHATCVWSAYYLGRCYQSRGRYDDALQLYRQTVDRIRKSFDNHGEAAIFNLPTVADFESCISHAERSRRVMEGDVIYLSPSEEEGLYDSDSEYDSEEEEEEKEEGE